MNTPQSGSQNRNAYRAALAPFEIRVSRLWIHDPGVRFKTNPIAPLRHVLELENGVSLLNISTGGTLIRITAPPHLAVLQMIGQELPDAEQAAAQGEEQAAPLDSEHLRDISMLLRLDGGNILVSCKIARHELVRATARMMLYDLALRFHAWGAQVHSVMQWHTVRDGNVPPLAAWIIRRQLSKNAMKNR